MPRTGSNPAQMRQRLARSRSLEPYEKPLNAAPAAGRKIARRSGAGTLEVMAAIEVGFGG